jgi:hypothetical protein
MIWSLLPFYKHSPQPHHPMLRFAMLGLLLLADPAQAAIKGCFARTYDAAHLAKHKGQDVTFMALQIGFEPNGEEYENLFQLRLRGSYTLLLNGFVCIGQGDKTHCKIIDSGHDNKLGGSFTLTTKDDVVLLSPDGDLSLVEEGFFSPRLFPVANNPEHKTFKLNRMGKDICPGFSDGKG